MRLKSEYSPQWDLSFDFRLIHYRFDYSRKWFRVTIVYLFILGNGLDSNVLVGRMLVLV